jgi:glycine dehydrogenase subunit 2
MKHLSVKEKLLFEKSVPGSGAFAEGFLSSSASALEKIKKHVPASYLRKEKIGLPEISERDLVQHYTHLAHRTFSVDANFYPLGSCTMKYNPKINEDIAALEGFASLHPHQNTEDIQGALKVLYHLERQLSFICGMDQFSLQPAAGAHGEQTALMMAKHYFQKRGEKRTKVVLPDSSHGTNPASAALCGLHVVTIPSTKNGEVDLEALAKECDENIAVFMLTNPNTLGLFEHQILQVCALVHKAGGLTYCDGANLNALMGISRPGDMGFDMMHVNTHKTLSTPHGGGGPGAGPVGVKSHLAEFLPVPRVLKEGMQETDRYRWSFDFPNSIGSVKTFWGNFGVLLRAAVYIDSLGLKGLQESSKIAILNANYLRKKLEDTFLFPYTRPCMHEFVMMPDKEKSPGKTIDIAKRLLDFGIHAPTVYFPLIVKDAIMIEPTETESKQTLDEFVDRLKDIAEEARMNPLLLEQAPTKTYRSRMDEVQAARNPVLQWID